MSSWLDRDRQSTPIDYPGLGEVANEIGTFLRRWGRVNVTQTKEKFGTIRVYCSLGIYSLHDLTHPGYHYNRYPNWLWKFDQYVIAKLFAPLNRLVLPYHEFLYRKAYQRALKKYPAYRNAILDCADWPELLKGL